MEQTNRPRGWGRGRGFKQLKLSTPVQTNSESLEGTSSNPQQRSEFSTASNGTTFISQQLLTSNERETSQQIEDISNLITVQNGPRGWGRGRGSKQLKPPTSLETDLQPLERPKTSFYEAVSNSQQRPDSITPSNGITSNSGAQAARQIQPVIKEDTGNMIAVQNILKGRGRGRGIRRPIEPSCSTDTAPDDHQQPNTRNPTNFAPRELQREENSSEQKIEAQRNAVRPNKKGSSGKPIYLRSNYFQTKSLPNWTIIQYHVDMIPNVELTRDKKTLLNVHRSVIGGYVFNGTDLFTSNRLDTPMELFSTHYSSGETIKIIIRNGHNLVPDDPCCIPVFNMIIKRCYEYLRLKLIGRDFFDADEAVDVRKHNLQIWLGYRSTLAQHQNSILMMVDVISKVVRKDTAYDILKSIRASNIKDEFNKEIIGKTIITDYNNKRYLIDDVDYGKTPLTPFQCGDEMISYVDYYYRKYNIKIRDRSQPLLISFVKNRNTGLKKELYLIPETCLLTGLTDTQRLNFTLMKDLSHFTKVNPRDRVEKLMRFNRRLRNNQECVGDFKKWNLELEPNLVKIMGRQLNAERLYQGRGASYYSSSNNYNWSRDLRSKELYEMPSITRWIAIIPTNMKRSGDQFMEHIYTAARGMSIQLPQAKILYIANDNVQSYVQTLEQEISQFNPQTILCFVLTDNPHRYAAIKIKCCVDRSVPIQVVTRRTTERNNALSIATNVMLQIACKIGGIPWNIRLPITSTTMIVGYDVFHKRDHDSYGATIATVNANMTEYFSMTARHNRGEEIANELASNIYEAAKEYRLRNNLHLPEVIIVYRDGVGQGQIHHVTEQEVNAVRSSLKKLYDGDNFKLAFIIVSKRINTRFFMDDPNFDNPDPGTVVDDIVTLPDRRDFFLVSQMTRVGTVSPTSYNIIFDNTGFSSDLFQRLTYQLCNLYYNYSGPIAVPAVCQYAHKLALLVGQYLKREPNRALRDKLYFI